MKYEKVLFEHEWSDLERTVQYSTTTYNSHSLSQGNHELPFELVIPGDIHESVEGLDGGMVVYKLLATIERGRFANNLYAKKHIRIVRTLGPSALELTQTMSIENIWPKKVDYTISIPSKAVAIGSRTPITIMLNPLLKGLKLGNIRVQLTQISLLSSPFGQTHQLETTICETLIPPELQVFEDLDNWEVIQHVDIPASLSKCTQDCTIAQYIKVSHKLKFAISLVNPDGHTSELRASLPIHLFISPNVAIDACDEPTSSGEPVHNTTLFAASSELYLANNGVHNGLDINAPPNYQDHIYDRLWNDIPATSFESPIPSGANTPHAVRSRRNSNEFELGTSPLGIGISTNSLDSIQRSQLAAGLRALEQQQRERSNSRGDSSINGSSSVMINGSNSSVGGTMNHSHWSSRSNSGANTPHHLSISSNNNPSSVGYLSASTSDYFTMTPHPRSPEGLMSPSGSRPNSRPGSRSGSQVGSPMEFQVDLEALSRVPSYSTAIQTETPSDLEWAPDYGQATRSPPFGISHTHSSPQFPTADDISLASNNRSSLSRPSQAHISLHVAPHLNTKSTAVNSNSAPVSSINLNQLVANGSITSVPLSPTLLSAASPPRSGTTSGTSSLAQSRNHSHHSLHLPSRDSSSGLNSLNSYLGLNFLNRNSSQRSLFEEASKGVNVNNDS